MLRLPYFHPAFIQPQTTTQIAVTLASSRFACGSLQQNCPGAFLLFRRTAAAGGGRRAAGGGGSGGGSGRWHRTPIDPAASIFLGGGGVSRSAGADGRELPNVTATGCQIPPASGVVRRSRGGTWFGSAVSRDPPITEFVCSYVT